MTIRQWIQSITLCAVSCVGAFACAADEEVDGDVQLAQAAALDEETQNDLDDDLMAEVPEEAETNGAVTPVRCGIQELQNRVQMYLEEGPSMGSARFRPAVRRHAAVATTLVAPFPVIRAGALTTLAWVYDDDSSRRLDESEIANLQSDLQARVDALLALYDADESGCLDPEEMAVRRQDLRAHVLENRDLDGNGMVTRDENREVARTRLEALDPEGDGLTDEEKAELRAWGQGRVRTGWFSEEEQSE